jgi:hypothetical protein
MGTRSVLPVAALALVALAAPALRGTARAQQQPVVTVGRNVHVSAAHARYPMREVMLAADPGDPRRLLACGMVMATREHRWWTVVYLSVDAGESWVPALETDKRWRSTIDPSCTMGLGGLAHHSALTSRQPEGDVMALWRSADGGRTWDERAPISMRRHGIDQQSVAVDTTRGRWRGRVYVVGGISYSGTEGARVDGIGAWVSTDSGKSFDGPTGRLFPNPRMALGISNAVVTSDGTLVQVFNEFPLRAGEFARSKPGSPNAVMSAISVRDGGGSVSRTTKVDDTYLSWPPGVGGVTPRLAVDPGSAAFKDRLYVTWSDERSGRFEVYVSHSADKAQSWSRPVAIGDAPPAASGSGPHSTVPTVAVNRDGVVGVTWYDRRDHPENMGWHVRFRASLDGGETWQPSVRVSSVPNAITARTELPTQAYTSGGGSGGFSGREPSRPGPLAVRINVHEFNFTPMDYAGLAVATDGVFHALWVDNRTGLPQIWMAPIRVHGVAARRAGPEPPPVAVDPSRVTQEPSAPGESNDVSSKVTLELTDSAFERETNTVSVVVRLGNVSTDTLVGPFHGRVTELSSELARRIELVGNAPGAGTSRVIDFSDVVPRGLLAPGQRSQPKRLVFRLSDLQPLRGPYEYRLDLVSMKVSVHAGPRPPAR